MAKHMGSDRYASFPSESPEERVHIYIGQCLACPRPLQFDEQVVCFNFYGVDFPDIGHDFIDESRRHINRAWRIVRFDLRPIL